MSNRGYSRQTREKLFYMLGGEGEVFCAYCDSPIDFESCEVDHFKPYSKEKSTVLSNAVLSCVTCNRLKSNRSFRNIEHARTYIFKARLDKGLPPMSNPIPAKTPMADILFEQVSNAQLVDNKPTPEQILDNAFGPKR